MFHPYIFHFKILGIKSQAISLFASSSIVYPIVMRQTFETMPELNRSFAGKFDTAFLFLSAIYTASFPTVSKSIQHSFKIAAKY